MAGVDQLAAQAQYRRIGLHDDAKRAAGIAAGELGANAAQWVIAKLAGMVYLHEVTTSSDLLPERLGREEKPASGSPSAFSFWVFGFLGADHGRQSGKLARYSSRLAAVIHSFRREPCALTAPAFINP